MTSVTAQSLPPSGAAAGRRSYRLAVVWGPAILVILFGALAYWGAVREQRSRIAVTESYHVIETLQLLLTRLVDAETGQRGYLLTNRADYLQPFVRAKSDVLRYVAEVRTLAADSPLQQRRLDSLSMLAGAKFEEMEQTIAIRQAGHLDGALAVVASDRGLRTMARIRELAGEIRRDEVAALASRSSRETRNSLVLGVILVVGSLLAAAVAGLMSHILDRYSATQEQIARELEEAYDRLQEQQAELEVQNEQLVEQSTELEAQGEELRAQNDQLTELTAQLETRTEAAEAANRAKATFLAAMSHDLRTPLNAIIGYVDLLALGIRGEVTAGQARDLDRIRRSARRLLALINDILNFARVEAGRVEIALQPVRLDSALRDLESSFLPQLTARGLRYRYDGADQELTVQADPDRLEQILLNVITNAIKFTPTGGEITLAVEAADHVYVRVSDTGVGIPVEQLSRIFEPFVQVDPRPAGDRERGVGLGLAISRELARAMGGDLTAESAPGVGSCFTLRLGRAEPGAGDARAEAA